MKYRKTLKIAVLLVSAGLALLACNSKQSSEAVESVMRQELTETKIVKQTDGVEIYKTNCAKCHGENGEGAKKGISFLKGHALHHPEEDFIRQVADGEDDKMPAFKDKLTNEEIKDVVKYVREVLQKKSGDQQKQSHKH